MNTLTRVALLRVRDLVTELSRRNDGWTYSLVAPPGSGKATAAVLLAANSFVRQPDEPVLIVASIDALARYSALLDGAGVRSRRWDLADLRERLSSSGAWEPLAHLVSDEFVIGTVGELIGLLPWSLVIIDGNVATTAARLVDALRTNATSRLFMIRTEKTDKYPITSEWTPFDAEYALPERRIIQFRRSDDEVSAIAALPRIAAPKEGLLERLDAAAASSLSALVRAINGVTDLSVDREVVRLSMLEGLSHVTVDEKVASLSALLARVFKKDLISVVLSSSSATLGYLETCLTDVGFTVQRHVRGQTERALCKVVLSNYTSIRSLNIRESFAGSEVKLPTFFLYDLPEDLKTWLEVMAMTRQPLGSPPATIFAFQDQSGGTVYERILLKRWRFLPFEE